MKALLASAALLTMLASPAVAENQAPVPDSSSSAQSIFRTVSTTEIVNSDGSVTEVTVVTVYYLFGYE